jgi:Co/Zn/Cd efflux system component
MTEMISLRELQQIRDTVSELRAVNPKSVLADLVEEKIRMIEACDPMLQFDVAHLRRHRPVMATRNVVSTNTDHTK